MVSLRRDALGCSGLATAGESGRESMFNVVIREDHLSGNSNNEQSIISLIELERGADSTRCPVNSLGLLSYD